MTQRDFLLKMGVEVRRERLLKSASDEERRKDIETGANRLISTNGMGKQYKCMAIASENPDDRSWRPYPFEVTPVTTSAPSGQATP